jgi:hypothetical protein
MLYSHQRSKRKIVVVVGNGLTLDLIKHSAPALDALDTSNPLHWPLPSPNNNREQLLDVFPYLKYALEQARLRYETKRDFDTIEKSILVAKAMEQKDFLKVDLDADFSESLAKVRSRYCGYALFLEEMRHFLAIAYSHFQKNADSYISDSWRWLDWFKRNANDIAAVVSFNYDLVVETILQQVGQSYYSMNVLNTNRGHEFGNILVLKPHGSIDLDIHEVAISFQNPISYPLKSIIRMCNTPMRRLNHEELMKPRMQPTIVVPSEYSKFVNFQTVAPGYKFLHEIGRDITHCVFVGLSYWECDQPEINFILKSMGARAKIISAKPNRPDQAFLEVAEKGNFSSEYSSRRQVVHWSDGPQDLP